MGIETETKHSLVMGNILYLYEKIFHEIKTRHEERRDNLNLNLTSLNTN